jgi:hypothetical protein
MIVGDTVPAAVPREFVAMCHGLGTDFCLRRTRSSFGPVRPRYRNGLGYEAMVKRRAPGYRGTEALQLHRRAA